MTPIEALASQIAKKPAKMAKTTVPRQLTGPYVQDLIRQLEQAHKENLSPRELEVIVDVIAAVLRTAHAENLLSEIASELSMCGLPSIAEAVRQRIRSGGTDGTQLVTT